jgi:hypothetical protein
MNVTSTSRRRSWAAAERIHAARRLRAAVSSSRLVRPARAFARRTVCFAVVLACTLPATLALGASPASAYERIDSRCILRAYEPFWGGGESYVVSGEVDCSGYGFVESQLEVCSQVYNPTYNKWYTVKGSCVTTPVRYAVINEEEKYETGVRGHVYRTWDWAYLPSDGKSATYESSGFTMP